MSRTESEYQGLLNWNSVLTQENARLRMELKRFRDELAVSSSDRRLRVRRAPYGRRCPLHKQWLCGCPQDPTIEPPKATE